LIKQFVADRYGGIRVGVFCIVMIVVTFIVYLVGWTPVGIMIEMLRPSTDNVQALRIYDLVPTVVALALVGSIVGYLIWWVASTARHEDQTYFGGVY
jgi:MFS superfamily sulfate permease-like transporter